MALTKYKLGELIKQRREKYDGEENLLAWGVSREGFILPKQEGADTSIYNVFYKNDFVFNPARMELNSIALNTFWDKAICSSLYEVFCIVRVDVLLPEYLNLYVKRDEFARRCWFEAVGSARNYFRVSNLNEFEIALPPLSIQQKYVDVYNSMLANQQSYERGLEDLKFTVDTLLDKYKKSESKVKMANLLEEIDNRNTDNQFEYACGVNITKQFMPSVASSSDLHNYKIVTKNQFVFSGMQTGRDECIRIALLTDDTSLIVSPAYTVFKIKSDNVIPEYIQMWFSRSETDRYGWFLSDASIRTNLDLECFYGIEIPLPDYSSQMAIVNIYKAYTNRRKINEQLKTQIKNICPILIKGSIEEARK